MAKPFWQPLPAKAAPFPRACDQCGLYVIHASLRMAPHHLRSKSFANGDYQNILVVLRIIVHALPQGRGWPTAQRLTKSLKCCCELRRCEFVRRVIRSGDIRNCGGNFISLCFGQLA